MHSPRQRGEFLTALEMSRADPHQIAVTSANTAGMEVAFAEEADPGRTAP
jgi:hypothetical protein